MIHIYVKGYNDMNANGVAVIVNNLVKYGKGLNLSIDCIGSLDGIPTSDTVIPFGPKDSKELIATGYEKKFSLMVDAISLGYLNKIKHYLKVGHFLHKDFLYSIYAYLRYSAYEKDIIRNYKNVILVSETDIEYLKKKNSTAEFICLRNGANMPQEISEKSQSNKQRIGILSSWKSFQANEENRWILKKYISRYTKDHPDVEFVLAGRGPRIKEYSSIPGVNIMGEVDSLDEFFSNIDVFLSANPKGCGILNRVLDAIAYKTPLIGHKGSFSGFRGMEKGFLSFDNYQSFCSVIETVKGDKELQAKMISEAYSYALDNLNWKNNYYKFFNQYIKPIV